MLSDNVSRVIQGQMSIHKVKLINFYAVRNRDFIFAMHVYLIEPHMLKYDMSRSRSSFKVNFNLSFIFLTSRDRDFIFGMHVYLMKQHMLSGDMSRSS